MLALGGLTKTSGAERVADAVSVANACALMQDPRIVLADEPIAPLDPMNAQVVMQSLRDIHETDERTVTCNLRTLDAARRRRRRVIGMRDDRVALNGKYAHLTTGEARDT